VHKYLQTLQGEADHHGGWIEAGMQPTALAAPPPRPLQIDDNCEQHKIQNKHCLRDKLQIHGHLRRMHMRCDSHEPSGSGESGERAGRRQMTECWNRKECVQRKGLLIEERMLLPLNDNTEEPQHRHKRDQEQGSVTMLHLWNNQQRQRKQSARATANLHHRR
jgi:hypothetical protein